MIALLALRPLRLHNFAQLTLGRDVLHSGGSWTIALQPSATKTHAALEYNWPDPLQNALETYLKVHRPFLLVRRGRWLAPVNDQLWVSADGSPFTAVGFYFRVIRQTRSAFGRPVNPHLFRDCAATALAINDCVSYTIVSDF